MRDRPSLNKDCAPTVPIRQDLVIRSLSVDLFKYVFLLNEFFYYLVMCKCI